MQTQLNPLYEERQPAMRAGIPAQFSKTKLRPLQSIGLMTDRELVDLYLGGNEAGLSTLVERHKARLFSFIIRRARCRDLAEDVFQETFFKAIRSLKAGMYDEKDKFINWIMRIARNMIIDHQRRAQRIRNISSVKNSEGEREDIFNVIDVGEKINIKHIEKRQAHRQVRHLIKRLPIEQRQVLVMREYFDMSFNEICRFRKMNLNTALGRMRYALINLKKMVQEDRLNSSDFL